MSTSIVEKANTEPKISIGIISSQYNSLLVGIEAFEVFFIQLIAVTQFGPSLTVTRIVLCQLFVMLYMLRELFEVLFEHWVRKALFRCELGG